MANLDLIESCVKPVEVLSYSGAQITPTATCVRTTCPGCGNIATVAGPSIYCGTRTCGYRAGSAVDYLVEKAKAWAEPAPVILKLVRDMHAKFPQHAQLQSAELLAAQAAVELQDRRRIRTAVAKYSRGTQDHTIHHSRVKMWLGQHDISPELFPLSIIPMSPDDGAELSAALNVQLRVPQGREFALFPILSNHHSVAALLVMYQASGFQSDLKMEMINIDPKAFVYWGLWDMHPSADSVLLRYRDVLQVAQHNSKASPLSRCLSFSLGLGDVDAAFVPAGARLWQPAGQYDLSGGAALRERVPDLRVATGVVPSGAVPWAEFLLQSVIILCANPNSLSSPAQTLLETSRPDPSVMSYVSSQLRRRGLLELDKMIARQVSTGPIYVSGDYKLHEFADSYTLVKERTNQRTPVTNFTLQIRQRVWFHDASRTCYAGTMAFDGKSYPFMVEDSQLENVEGLDRAVWAAVTNKAEEARPMIADRAAAKFLFKYLRTVASTAKAIEGFRHLGWDARKTTFYGPGFSLSLKDGMKRLEHHDPDLEIIKYYDKAEKDILAADVAVPLAARDIIAVAVAMAARFFLRHTVRPVRVSTSAEAKQLLAHIFAGVGQTDEILLTFNPRSSGELQGLAGFPAYAYGYSHGQAEKSQLPLLLLSETGMLVSDPGTPELGGMYRGILTSVVAWLLETGGAGYQVHRSVDYTTELTSEGEWLIKKVLGIDWATSRVPYQSFERALSQIPMAALKEHFLLDFANEKVVMRLEGLEGIDSTDLELELRKAVKALAIFPDRIEMDSLSGMALLQNFYKQEQLDMGRVAA